MYSDRRDWIPVSEAPPCKTIPKPYLSAVAEELAEIRDASLWKTERPLTSPQSAHIKVAGGRQVLNFCANNYLGLADHPDLIAAAKQALDTHGLGMASVRFICGTNDLHAELESKIAAYVGQEDSILYAACFDANGGVFEPLFGDKDAIISDSLNHASIIDGVRLSKAARYRYANGDMDDLETQLKAAREANARRIVIVTDGVFSMDGFFARLPDIRRLADIYGALIMVDDCHATGFIGPQGRGTPSKFGVEVDILSGHARQGARRLNGRLYRGGETHCRSPAPALAPLSLLQRPAPGDHRRRLQSHRSRP